MSFEETPTNIPKPENKSPVENDLSPDIEAEMFTLAEEAGKLEQEIKTLEAEGTNDNIDEEKKNDIFSQTRKITYAVAALLAIPLAAGVFKPEKAREINEAMSKLVNNNIPEMLTVMGVMVAAGTIYVIRLEIEDSKNRALCRQMFQSMIEKTETNNWNDLEIDLDNFREQLQKTVFSSSQSEKKEKKRFQEKLFVIKEKLDAQTELVPDNTLVKLNALINSLNYY